MAAARPLQTGKFRPRLEWRRRSVYPRAGKSDNERPVDPKTREKREETIVTFPRDRKMCMRAQSLDHPYASLLRYMLDTFKKADFIPSLA